MRLFVFALLLLGWACNPQSSQKQAKEGDSSSRKIDLGDEDNNQITCWGIGQIDLEDSYSTIEQKVGKENILIDSLFLEGNFERLITTLWKGREREIVVHWKETQPPFKNIATLEISNSQSPYHFTNGIKIGTTLKELAALNGSPVNLYGFGWDYGGTFTNFGKGKLSGDIPCFGGVFQLQTAEGGEDVMAIMGDHEISSSHPSFKKYDPVLTVIRISKK